MKTFLIAALIAVQLVGCKKPEDARNPGDAAAMESGGRHVPHSEEERLLLQRAAALPTGVKEKVGAHTVSASSRYHAASGFTCRKLFVETKGRQQMRLACGDEEGWFFVPDVYHEEQPMAGGDRHEVKISATGEATAISPQEGPHGEASPTPPSGGRKAQKEEL